MEQGQPLEQGEAAGGGHQGEDFGGWIGEADEVARPLREEGVKDGWNKKGKS